MRIIPQALFIHRPSSWRYHVLGWGIFIFYEMSLVLSVRSAQGIEDPIFTAYFIPYIINIGLFYLHAEWVMHHCFEKGVRRGFLFALLLALELFVYLILMGIKDASFARLFDKFPPQLYSSNIVLLRQLWRGLYFLLFSTGFWFIRRSFRQQEVLKQSERKVLLQEKEKRELELQLISSQNAFLQSQINPHLMFNTLSFVYNQVGDVSPKGAEAILLLSDMMRYSLSAVAGDGKQELEKEILQIDNLIQINQLRFEEALAIEFRIMGSIRSARIVPLLLLPFVENIFKHGDLKDSKRPARISISVHHGQLKFSTVNVKSKIKFGVSSRIGIENVKRRLRSYYEGRHQLAIEEDESNFCVDLELSL